ncbi:DUF4267 domain-containing protein [Colwellia psychrerythraea]|uniref:DUF4267 domain-containing protein n=1 Tax=Colwellia psychrerythraea TaxID=28229 RepID=A0A099KTF4_COLPS|nr:DUF4267 domain-containing protein [Colwellia psychrerythraea]KGJ93831.1 Protein of unknown function DUF4267 [Colwellia psychrerythraea]
MLKNTRVEKIAFILVALMILLQGFYGVFAYLDSATFANLRGTELFLNTDADWVKIYGSRTLFITLILGYLLYSRNYLILMWCALFGTIMPITDAWLAYEAQAPIKVVLKHLATIGYLVLIIFVLRKTITNKK